MEEEGQAPDLRALREAKGLDLASLSSATSLSIAQLRELEEGGSGHFYSEAIKLQAMRRVLRHLGAESVPPASATPLPGQATGPTGPGGVIQGIIRLSQTGDQYEDPRFSVDRPVALPSGVTWVAATIALGIVLVWAYPYEGVQTVASEFKSWLEPSPTRTVVVQPTVTTPTMTTEQQTPSTQDAATGALGTPPSAAAEAVSKADAPTPSAAVVQAAPAAATPVPPPVPVQTPAPAPMASSVASTTASACDAFKSEPVLVKPISIEKAAQFVYVLAKAPTVLCATDGQGKTTRLELTPGVGRSIYGPAPWVLANSNWSDLDMYFQGAKVWIPSGTPPRVRLNEQPLNKPTAPTQADGKN